jgi:hypothetical protein
MRFARGLCWRFYEATELNATAHPTALINVRATQPHHLNRESWFAQEIAGGAREDQELVQPMGCSTKSFLVKRAADKLASGAE